MVTLADQQCFLLLVRFLLACVCQGIHTMMNLFVSMNILTHFRGVEASWLRIE
jgi:hypothetical protein